MATTTGRPSADLKQRLLTKGKSHTFLQGVRLLRLLLRKQNGQSASPSETTRQIRVRPDLTLGYPREDIKSIEPDPFNEDRFLLTTTFLGLYGTSSPLPIFYTEDLLSEASDGNSVTRDFIDIVNSSLYSLFYRAWSKHQLLFNLEEEIDPALIEKMYCLLGIGDENFQKKLPNSYSLLRYIGLTTQHSRSAEGLRALLSDHLEEPSFEIEQCVSHVATIPQDQRCHIGVQGCTLGENAYLGGEIMDRMGMFRIHIGPLDPAAYHRFLPDQGEYKRMEELIGFYLDQPLSWDVALNVDPKLVMPTRLGKGNWAQLGWDTWLFSFGNGPEKTEVTLRPS